MVSGDHYRVLAADCDARAISERVLQFKAEWEQLALGYRRLAQQADRNKLYDMAYAPSSFDGSLRTLNNLPD
jgi:hypothetical protein